MAKISPPNSDTSPKELSGFFTGVVTSSDPVSYNVIVTPLNQLSNKLVQMQGFTLSSYLCPLFGFKECSLPQPGARVFCYSITPEYCYILGIIPPGDIGNNIFPSRTVFGQGDSIVDSGNLQGYVNNLAKFIFHNMGRPTDLVSGDHCIHNDFGVLLGLFQQFATLKGSELAQVQTFLLDDLVRIISHNFQHYSVLGEYNIFHDGKIISAEFSATHNTQESLGQPFTEAGTETPFKESGVNVADDSQNLYEITANERVKAVERFKTYLGRLGDFINAFISIPASNVLDYAGTAPTTPDLGVSHVHAGIDGGIHIRSLKEIFIEKTNWIRVPQRVFMPEDPTGDDGTAINFVTKKEFEFDNSIKVNDNPILYYLQLRDYVAYVNQVQNYQNFSSLPKDFALNNDLTKEQPASGLQNKADTETPTANQNNYVQRKSGFYLQPNGGVVIRDASGSSIVMEGGNIYIQAAKDIILQPQRSLIGKIGQNISLAAQNQIDLSSTSGGFRLKTDQAQYLYSDNSGIVIEAHGQTGSTGLPTDDAIQDIAGVVLKSQVGLYSYAPEILQYATNNLAFQSDGNIFTSSKYNNITTSLTDIIVNPGGDYLLSSNSGVSILAANSVELAGATATNLGQKNQALGVVPKANSSAIFSQPYGTIDVASEQAGIQDLPDALEEITTFNTKVKLTSVEFKFLNSSDYNIEQADAIPQTMAQQDDILLNNYQYTEWTETPVNGTLPYPGVDLFDTMYITRPLSNVFPNAANTDLVESPTSTNSGSNLQIVSLQQYKVYES